MQSTIETGNQHRVRPRPRATTVCFNPTAEAGCWCSFLKSSGIRRPTPLDGRVYRARSPPEMRPPFLSNIASRGAHARRDKECLGPLMRRNGGTPVCLLGDWCLSRGGHLVHFQWAHALLQTQVTHALPGALQDECSRSVCVAP